MFDGTITSSPGPDIEGPQREDERIEAVAEPDAVLRAAVGRIIPLEGLDFLSENVPAAVQHARHRRIDLDFSSRYAALRSRKGIMIGSSRYEELVVGPNVVARVVGV